VSSSFPFLDHAGPIAFAHRGGAAEGAENSLAAFRAAVDLGFRYLETDVHATSDGVLLAFHDQRLDRVTDRVGRVARLPYERVRLARIGGREPIPRFEELLTAFPDTRLNVDVKAPSAILPLVAAIQRAGALERVCVASFSGRRLTAVRAALGPRLCTALSPAEVVRLWRWSRRRAGQPPRLARGAVCVQVPTALGRWLIVDERLVAAAHQLGLVVHVWTVDDPVLMTYLLDLGVDGIMTDRPAVLRAVLAERGVWA
jgi:glycerophosphoryl diester phosphodiesterase